ncbi:MAG: CDP-alcohol phosphatidyltransferase family protein [Novosphingobium sp.]|nr:CDP-alcohol phosphatidyltransferase family protein [Novosphingobium sp.]
MDVPADHLANARRPRRVRELQDPLNLYLYHPLAWHLARLLAKTPLTPNIVSILGGMLVISAAIVYAQPSWPLSAMLGMALHMAWHVVDGADGDLAWMTGRSSPIGEMVDGLCDYLSHIVLYVLLGWMLWHTDGLFSGWNAVWLILAAGLSHAVQANHAEVQKRQYQYWVYGTPWLRMSHDQSDSETSRSWAGKLVSAYIGVASGMTPHALKIDAAVAAAQGKPDRLAAIAQAVRAESPPLLFMTKLLGPNPRAVLLGLSMVLLATPLWYLLYQVLVLGALLVLSVQMHNAAARRIAATIGA